MSINAQAYFIASNTEKIDSTKPTHIMMAGKADKLGELFLHSLLTKSQVIKEKYPENQLVIIGRNEDQDFIARSGFKIIESNSMMLKEKALEDVIDLLQNIRSLDIYAHSNAAQGIVIDKNMLTGQLLNEKDGLWDKLPSKISKDTYIMIHGCNSGVKLGPELAKKLRIAVLAALTGTDFQNIYSDSFWTQEYNASKDKISPSNKISYSEEKVCRKGFCTRMKPDNSSYKGHWGDWSEGGYPTFKIFCGSNVNSDCAKGAIEALLSFPSVLPASYVNSIDRFKDIVQDFLCPFGFSTEKQNECKKNLEASLVNKNYANYSPFRGQTLNCDFERCFAHFKCNPITISINPGACKLKNERPGPNATFTNEYKFLIEGFGKH
jgi:hypothetical protein